MSGHIRPLRQQAIDQDQLAAAGGQLSGRQQLGMRRHRLANYLKSA